MKKKLLLCLLSFVMLLGLTACSDGNGGIANEDGSIKSYTEDQIPEGLYIKRDDLYYPFLSAGYNEEGYQWFTSFDEYIPVMYQDDVLIYYSEQGIAENFVFNKMIDFGYTVGLRFTQKNGELTFSDNEEDYCGFSPVKSVILDQQFVDKGVNDVRIREVNGREFKETMLTADGFMKGLTKDAMYKFWYYQGTVYSSINIKADTHVFIEDYQLSTASYIELKEKVFEVNLPSSIESGFWYIEGYGLFEYRGPDTDLILDGGELNDDLISDFGSLTLPSNNTETNSPETTEPSDEDTNNTPNNVDNTTDNDEPVNNNDE